MKKIIIVLLFAGLILLSFSSCKAENQEYSYTIRDALKISAWVLDKSIDENGYFTEDEHYVHHCYWEEIGGRIIDSHEEDVFVLDRLKLNEVRTMVPMAYMMTNLNIYCEFDGIIEVDTDDEYIRMANISNTSDFCMEYTNVRWTYELCVNVCPLDRYYSSGEKMVMLGDAKVGREYSLNVNAYRFENEESPIIRAKLKFIVLEDKTSPGSEDFLRLYPKGRSRFLSVEMISYEYSDVYIILDELWDAEEEDD